MKDSVMKVSLSGIVYQLGEETYNYSEANNFEALLGEYNLSNAPGYWGWGNFRRTRGSIFDLLRASIKRTLEAVPVTPDEVDLVLFCSAGSGEYYHVVNEKLGGLLHEAGLQHPLLLGQCFTGCVSVFSAIRLGLDLIRSNAYANILVVAVDKVPGDVERFRKFALYSDAASSFLLSGTCAGDYEVLEAAVHLDAYLMAGMPAGQDGHFQHLNVAHARVMRNLDLDTKGFRKIFMTNLYKPLVQINTVRLGYSAKQCFFDNISRVGHCFSSDPFVNLNDYRAADPAGAAGAGDLYMLAAMASGHAGFCAIRANE